MHRIATDPDFIYSKRFGYSLAKLLIRYQDSCPDHISAAVLLMDEADFVGRYDKIVSKLRQEMGVKVDSL
jgi:hypothetical protein